MMSFVTRMRTLKQLLFIGFALSITSCRHPYSSTSAAFHHYSEDKATMLDAFFRVDSWLRQHGFEPCADPGSEQIAGKCVQEVIRPV
jgi:hypothetical protein